MIGASHMLKNLNDKPMIGTKAVSVFISSLLLSTILSANAFATDWYVDGANGNDGNPGTQAQPFLTSGTGIHAAQPGDTLHLLPTTAYPQIIITKSGTPGASITLIGDGAITNRTQIRTTLSGGYDYGISTHSGASYINILNFDVEATGKYAYGISVNYGSNHIIISDNVVHDCGMGGIGTGEADYVTISHNTVYSNSKNTSASFGSGISLYESMDSDSNTDVKMIVDGNIVYNNTNTPNASVNGGADSDGSGIVLDDNRNTQGASWTPPTPYHGRFLVQNNIVFNNGGRGIHIFYTDNATVINNTVFYNNQDPYEGGANSGEIEVMEGGGNISIYNNILVGDGNVAKLHVGLLIAYANDGVGRVDADYNLIYNLESNQLLKYYQTRNSNTVTIGDNNIWGNPLFVNASVNPATADFHLQAGSPGLGSGNPVRASLTDVAGVTRPSTGVDMGVYQQTPGSTPAPTPAPTPTPIPMPTPAPTSAPALAPAHQ